MGVGGKTTFFPCARRGEKRFHFLVCVLGEVRLVLFNLINWKFETSAFDEMYF